MDPVLLASVVVSRQKVLNYEPGVRPDQRQTLSAREDRQLCMNWTRVELKSPRARLFMKARVDVVTSVSSLRKELIKYSRGVAGCRPTAIMCRGLVRRSSECSDIDRAGQGDVDIELKSARPIFASSAGPVPVRFSARPSNRSTQRM